MPLASITGITAPIDDDHVLEVTCTFQASGSGTFGDIPSGSDGTGAMCYMIQNGVTTYGDIVLITTSRAAYTAQASFPLAAGYAIECGLEWAAHGIVSATYYNIKVNAEVVKR